MNREGAGALAVEKIISLLLAYGVAPAVMLLYWARYLTLQDLHGTTLQALVAAAAVGITLYVMTRVGRPQEKWALEEKPVRRFTDKLKTDQFRRCYRRLLRFPAASLGRNNQRNSSRKGARPPIHDV